MGAQIQNAALVKAEEKEATRKAEDALKVKMEKGTLVKAQKETQVEVSEEEARAAAQEEVADKAKEDASNTLSAGASSSASPTASSQNLLVPKAGMRQVPPARNELARIDLPQSRAPSVEAPDLLWVVSPNGQGGCIGEYKLQPRQHNVHPIWRKLGTDYTIHSDGRGA